MGRFRFLLQTQGLIDEVAIVSCHSAFTALQHNNRLLDRRQALIKLWGEDNVFTARGMDVYITRLRKYFRADADIDINNSRDQVIY